jgi:hypothetical protein
MNLLGIVEDSFGQRGFSRIDMGADADVTHFLQIDSHKFTRLNENDKKKNTEYKFNENY